MHPSSMLAQGGCILEALATARTSNGDAEVFLDMSQHAVIVVVLEWAKMVEIIFAPTRPVDMLRVHLISNNKFWYHDNGERPGQRKSGMEAGVGVMQ